jgi:hypothetical protein
MDRIWREKGGAFGRGRRQGHIACNSLNEGPEIKKAATEPVAAFA